MYSTKNINTYSDRINKLIILLEHTYKLCKVVPGEHEKSDYFRNRLP